MHITLIAVTSLNGKITAGENTRVHDWASKEDQRYFTALKEKSRLIIMGRKTFDAGREHMTLSPKLLRVVLTKNPGAYKKFEVPKQLEFTDESPETVLKRLEKIGQKKALLVGGAEINTAFLKQNLVNELWLTVEPLIIGQGKNLFSETELHKKILLRNVKKLNKNGTLLLKYKIECS